MFTWYSTPKFCASGTLVNATDGAEPKIEARFEPPPGGMVSFTVTVAVAVDELPLASLTVRVTVFAPRLLQVKVVWLRLSTRLAAAVQLSEEPLLTWAAVMVTLPVV